MKTLLVLVILIGLVLVFLLGLIGWQTGFLVKDVESAGRDLISGELISQNSDITERMIDKTEEIFLRDGSSGGSSSNGGSEDNHNIIIDYKTKLKIESHNVKEGETFIVGINIDAEEEIYAVHLELEFDPSIVKVNKITEKFINKDSDTYPIINIDNSKGKITYASTRFETQNGISGVGILIEIEFIALKNGISNLSFGDVKILNSDLESVEFGLSDGSVKVN